jgi:hypothetical protein
MKALVFIALLVFLTQDGCDQTGMKAKADQAAADRRAARPAPKSRPVTRICSTDHRFERTEVYPQAFRADIAPDTCTGQLCRTWPWAPKTTNAWSAYQDLPLSSELPNQR